MNCHWHHLLLPDSFRSSQLRSLVVDDLKLVEVRVTQTSDRYFKSSSENVKTVRGTQDNIVLSTVLVEDGDGDNDNEWCFENAKGVGGGDEGGREEEELIDDGRDVGGGEDDGGMEIN